MKNICKKIYSIFCIIFILAAFVFNLGSRPYVVLANEATTYTKTINADNQIINSQNGYYPGVTYDRIGLRNPKDMVLLQEEISGEMHDIAYILNCAEGGASSFILRVDLSDNAKVLNSYSLSFLLHIKQPVGITIQKVVDDEHLEGQYKVYICDELASFVANNEYTYKGLIYRFNLDDLKNNATSREHYDIITEPTEMYNGHLRKLPAFGKNTDFSPVNIAVDTAGTMYVASKSTTAGLIQFSSAGEFIGFFVVNNVQQSLIYRLVKFFNNKEQLELIQIKEPPAFTNVFMDSKDLVYSVTQNNAPSVRKHASDGRSLLSIGINDNSVSDIYVTEDGFLYIAFDYGIIYVFKDNELIYFFGVKTKTDSNVLEDNVAGFFLNLKSIIVDGQHRIWALDDQMNFLQSLIPTTYSNQIFRAYNSFAAQDYEDSRKAWEEVLNYDSLSVIANDGIGKAYYYDGNFEEAVKYFKISKNRTLYSECYWEIRNDWTSQNLVYVLITLVGIVALIFILKLLFNKIESLRKVKASTKQFFERRFFKDLGVGFRLIKKPGDTFYELKSGVRGSFLGATLYYILGLAAVILYTYGKALPFQYVNFNTLNVAIVLIAYLVIFAIFVISNYLVSSISDGEGTFMNIYKFTGYSLLPLIICLPIATGISYALTLTETVIIDGLYLIAVGGSIYFLIFGILETHNYTFKKTMGNIVLTLVGMILIIIVCIVVFVMFDQLSQLLEGIWKEVKLRVGWY